MTYLVGSIWFLSRGARVTKPNSGELVEPSACLLSNAYQTLMRTTRTAAIAAEPLSAQMERKFVADRAQVFTVLTGQPETGRSPTRASAQPVISAGAGPCGSSRLTAAVQIGERMSAVAESGRSRYDGVG
jgi:hypothetical protein